MDIFKKLTKGIKGTKIGSFEAPVKAEPVKITPIATASLPKELDFFGDAVKPEEPSHSEEHVLPDLEDHFKPFSSTEELESFRRAHHIRIALHQTSDTATGEETTVHHVIELNDPDQVLPIRSFSELPIDPRIMARIAEVRAQDHAAFMEEKKRKSQALLQVEDEARVIERPTPVQMQATPVLLTGRDMIVMAPTGSGKTLAFALGILGKILAEKPGKFIHTLIISPTRELAEQITQQLRRFAPLDETNKNRPLVKVSHLSKAVVNGWNEKTSPHILVTTPLRLIHALRNNLFTIDKLKLLILDEADRLLDDGFDEQLDELLVAMKEPGRVQKALFSATMPSGVEATARSIMNAPYRVICGCVDPNATAVTSITQELIYCGSGLSAKDALNIKHQKQNFTSKIESYDESVGKLMALKQMIQQGRLTPPCLIFVGSAVRAERLYKDLISWSTTALARPLPVDYLHSGRDQSERTAVIEAFRQKKLWFLITTDVLARGLDFPPLSAVINYDFPDSTATYIHRIGRTGRAGRSGAAYTFYTQADVAELRIVVNVMRRSGCQVPDWMVENYTKSLGDSRLRKKLKYTKTEQKK